MSKTFDNLVEAIEEVARSLPDAGSDHPEIGLDAESYNMFAGSFEDIRLELHNIAHELEILNSNLVQFMKQK